MSRKGENIYKRKDGRWEGRYIKARSQSGKAVYGYVYAPTYKEAKRKRSQAKCSIRTIPIPDRLIQLIQKEFPNRQGYVLATVNEKYIEPRTMQNYFRYVQKQCGLVPVNFHALRHTFATRCIEFGFDIKSLSEILGHATVNITLNRYVHPSMELKQQNMQKLSSLLTVI